MIDAAQFREDPVGLLAHWLAEARAAGAPEPDAMTLATATPDGRPSARVVLCRGIDHHPEGVRFYTNYESRKGRELLDNTRAALLFFWPTLGRQVRVEGAVEVLTPEESDAYFRGRPRGHQIGAWASAQSRPVVSTESVRARAEQIAQQYDGVDVPRPPYWGGYRVRPEAFEFWQAGADRLHDRLVFARNAGRWATRVLSP